MRNDRNVSFQSNIDDLVLNMTSAPNFDIEKSLFIATWSLSEAPIKIRENIESIISCFKYILIAYQHSHSGFDNLYYFNNLVSKFDQYEWVDRKIKHLEGNSYLFGYRK